jgi:tRNA uridine 5-carboxymethylaminomethyl modification enzyme
VLDLFGRGHERASIQAAFPWLINVSAAAQAQLEVEALYQGYLTRQATEVKQLRTSEAVQLPAELDYGAIGGLSTEAREKLEAVRPRSLAILTRIPGINPPAVMAVLGHLRRAQA